MYNSILEKKYKKEFTLDEGKLRKILDLLVNFKETNSTDDEKRKLTFEVKRNNDVRQSETDIEKILSDTNPTPRKILKLTITLNKSKEYSSDDLCIIMFNAIDSYDKGIHIEIGDMNRKDAFILLEDLDIHISRCINKSNNLVRFFSRILWYFGPLALLLGCSMLISNIFNFHEIKIMTLNVNHLLYGMLLIFYTTLLFIEFYTENSRSIIEKWIEPKSVFLWGDQKEIYIKKEKLRDKILWGILIAFLISLSAGLLLMFIK
jgi:hypothetical protein